MKMGVTYWDTADSYGGGENEEAIGAYFAKYPEDRKKVFLVTKTAATDPKDRTFCHAILLISETTGNTTVKVEPLPGWLSAIISPPWFLIIP